MRAYSILAASCAALALSSCGPSFDGPQPKDIDQFLEMELPEGIDAQDLEIQAVQNVGDEIEPIYRSRVKVNLVLEEDFATVDDYVGERPVIKITKKKGTEIPAIIFTRSEPLGSNDWKVETEKLQFKSFEGNPVSTFENPIIKGSAEEKTAIEAAKKQAAEEEREEKAKVSAAQKAFVGNWKASQPLMSYGSVYSSNGVQVGISFNLGPNTDGFGKGTGLVYDFNKPSVAARSDVTYTVNDDGSLATVTFLSRAQHEAVPWYVSEDTNFNLTSDGNVTVGGYGRWSIKLSK
ncbi:MAG: hypothetical protein CVT75_03110 [Alphaproteobacteria bacterium HGW-Alphaproteobacteria-14]|nr:MAG: hypothetical protein CVT75_03110 [Alphaproteobacteria bacterium HGW-Alphaproteobacteria-14]